MPSSPNSWLVAAAAGALTVGLAGCSGSPSDTRTDAVAQDGTSVTELCGALTDFQADLAGAATSDPAAYVAQLKAAATRLRAVGLPEGMPADAQAGFTQQVDVIDALPDAATGADLNAVGKAPADPALEDYLSTICPAP